MTSTADENDSGGPLATLCDFCGRPTAEAGPMVEGNALVQSGAKSQDTHVCQDCVRACQEIFQRHTPRPELPEQLPTPRELVAHLDEYIVGQDLVKRTLAVAVINHYKRPARG